MNILDIILKKRDGKRLSKEDIEFFVRGYSGGEIPDYQMSALLMAIYFRKLNREETYLLTEAVRNSGDTMDLSEIGGIKVDKHSTGGVGDKTTLVVAPIAAACGIPIAKMSGRGLGFTGGTVDKLESIPGFRTTLEPDEFIQQVKDIGIAVIGQSGHLTPADKKLYALRDVTGTVDDISLIASSVMSKKLAAGNDAILLDVKCGKGAFMESIQDARTLAALMCEIGEDAGRKMMAVITDMTQPLGNSIGNSLEVIEAIEVLKGRGPEDVTKLSLIIAGAMIYLGSQNVSEFSFAPGEDVDVTTGKAARSLQESISMAREALESGKALEKFRTFIERQGGDPGILGRYTLLKGVNENILSAIGMESDVISKGSVSDSAESMAKHVFAERSGFVQEVDAQMIGVASMHTGAGRMTKEDEIDYGAGIILKKKIGDRVEAGEILATCFGAVDKTIGAAHEISQAFVIGDEEPEIPTLVKDIVEGAEEKVEEEEFQWQ